MVEKEVPIETIKEVEKIVEKEIYVTDDETINNLQKELESTKENHQEIIESMNADSDSNETKIKDLEDEVILYKDMLSELEDEKNVEIKTLNRKITDLNKNISHLKNNTTKDDRIKELEEELSNNVNDTTKDNKIKNLESELKFKEEEINYLYNNEKKHKKSLKSKTEEINDLKEEITELKDNLKLFKDESKERGKTIKELNDKIDELESQDNTTNKEDEDDDIYGDNKKGLFGSNTSDIWNKKK